MYASVKAVYYLIHYIITVFSYSVFMAILFNVRGHLKFSSIFQFTNITVMSQVTLQAAIA